MLSQPPVRENSRKYSPHFSRKVRDSVLRTLARKASKHKGNQGAIYEDV